MKPKNTKLITIRKKVVKAKTQQEFANLTGLHRQTIIKLETGGYPDIHTLKTLEKTFRKHGLYKNPSILELF